MSEKYRNDEDGPFKDPMGMITMWKFLDKEDPELGRRMKLNTLLRLIVFAMMFLMGAVAFFLSQKLN